MSWREGWWEEKGRGADGRRQRKGQVAGRRTGNYITDHITATTGMSSCCTTHSSRLGVLVGDAQLAIQRVFRRRGEIINTASTNR